VQDWHLLKITKATDGSMYRKPEKVIVREHKDSYAADCKMPKP
jgi:branched-chain amino acid transport system substrate-binding protein